MLFKEENNRILCYLALMLSRQRKANKSSLIKATRTPIFYAMKKFINSVFTLVSI